MPETITMVITLTGNNHFLITQKLSEIVTKFVRQYGDLSVEKLDGEEAEIERINESLQNLPFLIPKKLVVLRDPSKNKQFAENIEQIIGSIPETTEAVIIESKIDKRHSYYKTLKVQTDFEELNELSVSDFAEWVVQLAKKEGGQISRNDAHYLTERVAPNQQLIYNEIKKLISYQPNINRESINLLTEPTPQSSVFDLLDAAFGGQASKTLRLYEEQRRQRVEPLAIMAMISWQLHILALIKAAGERSQAEIAKEAGVNPYVVSKSSAITNKISLRDLKELINQALKLDVSLKSQSIDADEALKHFLLTLG